MAHGEDPNEAPIEVQHRIFDVGFSMAEGLAELDHGEALPVLTIAIAAVAVHQGDDLESALQYLCEKTREVYVQLLKSAKAEMN